MSLSFWTYCIHIVFNDYFKSHKLCLELTAYTDRGSSWNYRKIIINHIRGLLFSMDRLIFKLFKLFLWYSINAQPKDTDHAVKSLVNSGQFFLKRVSMNATHNSLKLILPTFVLVYTVLVFQSQSNRILRDGHMLLWIHQGVLHFFGLLVF